MISKKTSSEQNDFPGKIQKTGKGVIEFSKTTIELNDQNRKVFMKDPELYFKKFLESKGRKVNGLIWGAKSLKNQMSELKGATRPINTLVVVEAHVEKPKKIASQTIIIITEKGAKKGNPKAPKKGPVKRTLKKPTFPKPIRRFPKPIG